MHCFQSAPGKFVFHAVNISEEAHNRIKCGKPAQRPAITIWTEQFVGSILGTSKTTWVKVSPYKTGDYYPESSTIMYKCTDQLHDLLVDSIGSRFCSNGQWTGVVPRCGKFYFNLFKLFY